MKGVLRREKAEGDRQRHTREGPMKTETLIGMMQPPETRRDEEESSPRVSRGSVALPTL